MMQKGQGRSKNGGFIPSIAFSLLSRAAFHAIELLCVPCNPRRKQKDSISADFLHRAMSITMATETRWIARSQKKKVHRFEMSHVCASARTYDI